jgi:ketosteroid isomerase-like protein
MSSDNPVAVVQRMLEAFEDRDLDRLVETVHPDSRWTYVGANPRPAKGIYVGRDGVRKFFENILRHLTITTFHTREFVTLSSFSVSNRGRSMRRGIPSETNAHRSMLSKTA